MRNKLILSILTGLGLNLLASAAMAGPALYPASMCVRWGASDPVGQLGSSQMFNTSANWMRLDCPVIRTDFDGFLYWSAIEDSKFYATNRNYDTSLCSTLVKYLHVGSTESWGTGNTGTRCISVGVDPQTMDTGSMGLGHPNYHIYFSVWVPPVYSGNSSSVVNYYVNQ